tara:strand:- start:745 stop:1338 length:594 start_codon:yes stop_codon:yes gene_type:complete
VTNRKKNILLIQVLIFILASLLIYYTYIKKSDEEFDAKKLNNNTEKENEETETVKNTFTDVEYKGVDLRGNRYKIKSEIADFEIEKPELINMKIMSVVFYFKDGTTLEVSSDYGAYNNKTNDMEFRSNVKAKYEENYLFAENLDFFNTKNFLSIYGNVRSESIQGKIVADSLNFDLLKQTLDISMFSEKQVNVKIKN